MKDTNRCLRHFSQTMLAYTRGRHSEVVMIIVSLSLAMEILLPDGHVLASTRSHVLTKLSPRSLYIMHVSS